MTIHLSDWAKGTKSGPYPANAGVVVALRATFAFTSTQNVANDIMEMLELPPGCVPVDAILDTDDLDTDGAPALVLDVGLMSGTFGDNESVRTCADELFDGITTGQAGGLVRPTLAKAQRISPSNVSRGIGIKVMTVAATPASGTIGLTVFYVAP